MRRVVVEMSDEYLKEQMEDLGLDTEQEVVDEFIESINDFVGIEAKGIIIFEEVDEE